jgi:hypothetical protein
MANETTAAAMNFLANTDALIIDLRRNGGGQPEMVALLSSYLFDQRAHLNDIYSRFDNRTQEYWTRDTVAGKRYGESKPVYVLTSKRTFSGAEEFAYNLKNLKRATVIGEVTGGGAHPVRPHRLTDHFMIGVPFARAINPITQTNWEGVGVTPDIDTTAEQALKVAHLAALKNLMAKATDQQRANELQRVIATTQKELGATIAGDAAATAAGEDGLKLRIRRQEIRWENSFALSTPAISPRCADFTRSMAVIRKMRSRTLALRAKRRAKLHSVISSSEHAIEVLVQSKKDESWLSFAISVAALPPHGITDIRVRPTEAPK